MKKQVVKVKKYKKKSKTATPCIGPGKKGFGCDEFLEREVDGKRVWYCRRCTVRINSDDYRSLCDKRPRTYRHQKDIYTE